MRLRREYGLQNGESTPGRCEQRPAPPRTLAISLAGWTLFWCLIRFPLLIRAWVGLVQVAMYSFFRGEAFEIVGQWNELLGGYALYVVAATGVASFIISVCTMQATKFATPLTVSVLGVFKQVRKARRCVLGGGLNEVSSLLSLREGVA